MQRSIWRKLFGSTLKLVLPAILLIILAAVVGSVWLVHLTADEPPRTTYLITPERFKQITNNAKEFTEETWVNHDGTSSRGWFVRGATGAPAVILLHRYGADRSWLLNLGVKLYTATGFTVLVPDLRGHGENPTVKYTSLGGCEGDDLAGALDFLRAQKGDPPKTVATKTANNEKPVKTEPVGDKLVGPKIGVYGVEIGAIAAMMGAANSNDIQALALDSVPASTGSLLQSVVAARTGVVSYAIAPLAGNAAPLYFMRSCYKNTPLCETAASLGNRKVLLLAGKDTPEWQESTNALASCFGGANVQKNTDLQPSGYNLIQIATPEQQEVYNKLVIDFFRGALQ